MKTSAFAALLLASALSVAGCNKGAAPAANNAAPAAPAAPKPADTNTAAPAPAPEASGETGAPTGTVGTARQNFSILNSTGHVVMTVKVSPTSETSWGPDILGSNVLQNGQTLEVAFDRSTTECNYDIQATYDDGDTTDMRNVDLCRVGTVNLIAQ
jgi:hypothetical protein